MDNGIDYKAKYEQLKAVVAMYEQNGAAKLYYSLNRKMWEMADMLNKNSLSSVNLDDPKDKSFDRIFRILEKSEVVSNSAKALRDFAGITGDETEDVNRRPFKQLTTSEFIANVLENSGRQDA